MRTSDTQIKHIHNQIQTITQDIAEINIKFTKIQELLKLVQNYSQSNQMLFRKDKTEQLLYFKSLQQKIRVLQQKLKNNKFEQPYSFTNHSKQQIADLRNKLQGLQQSYKKSTRSIIKKVQEINLPKVINKRKNQDLSKSIELKCKDYLKKQDIGYLEERVRKHSEILKQMSDFHKKSVGEQEMNKLKKIFRKQIKTSLGRIEDVQFQQQIMSKAQNKITQRNNDQTMKNTKQKKQNQRSKKSIHQQRVYRGRPKSQTKDKSTALCSRCYKK